MKSNIVKMCLFFNDRLSFLGPTNTNKAKRDQNTRYEQWFCTILLFHCFLQSATHFFFIENVPFYQQLNIIMRLSKKTLF